MALQRSIDIQETIHDNPQHDGTGIEMSHIAGNIYDSLEGRDRESHAYSTTREAVATVKTGTHNIENKAQPNDTTKRVACSCQKFELSMWQIAVAMVFICTLICTISGSIVYHVVNARIVEIEMCGCTLQNHGALEEKQSDLDRRLVTVEAKQNTSELATLDYQANIDRRMVTVETKQNTSVLATLDYHANIDERLGSIDNVIEAVQDKHNTSEMASLDHYASIDQRLETLDNAIETVQNKQNISDQQVAFTAHTTTGKTVNNVLTFNNVIMNVGNGYDQITGRFRCSVAGTYLFSATLVSVRVRSGGTYCWIRNNAAKVAFVLSNEGTYDTASVSILFHLSVGDMVDLGNCVNVNFISTDYRHTSFIGSLIQTN